MRVQDLEAVVELLVVHDGVVQPDHVQVAVLGVLHQVTLVHDQLNKVEQHLEREGKW